MSGKPVDRRPIAARAAAPIIRGSDLLIRLGVSPNAISLAGCVASIIGGVAFALAGDGAAWLWLLGALTIGLRGLANLWDGMVAVGAGRTSPTGEIWNDLPDRISDIALLVGAGIGAGEPTLGIAAAFVALLVAYARVIGKACGASSAWHGPMAKPHRMALLALGAVVECAGGGSLIELDASGSGFSAMAIALVLIILGGIVTTVRRLRIVARELNGTSGQANHQVA